jgi:hypothetical protein
MAVRCPTSDGRRRGPTTSLGSGGCSLNGVLTKAGGRRPAAQDGCTASALLRLAAVRGWWRITSKFPGRGNDGLTKGGLDG